MKQWLIKGMWYFDKKYSELIYRPIGLAPVTKPLQKNDEEDFGGGGNTDDDVQRSIPPEADGADQDGDGLSDEFENETDYDGRYSDSEKADSDEDGVNDGLENKNGFDPTDGSDGAQAREFIYATVDKNDDDKN